jgi:hypothetical protein
MVVGSQIQVCGMGGRSTANGGTRFVMNGVSVNDAQSSISSTNMKGARIGGYRFQQGTANTFDLYAIVGIAGELSNARIDAVAAALVASYDTPAITQQIIIEGGSVAFGYGLASNESPSMLLTNPGAELVPRTTRVVNMAVTGSTVASLTTRRDRGVGGWPGTVLPGGSANNLLTFLVGANDADTDTGATIATNISTYLGQATTGVLARGFNAHPACIIGINNAPKQAKFVDLRAALRDPSFNIGLDAQTGGANAGRVNLVSLDLIEYAGSQRFNTAAHAADTTYYKPDGTHLQTVGNALLVSGGTTPTYGWGSVL